MPEHLGHALSRAEVDDGDALIGAARGQEGARGIQLHLGKRARGSQSPSACPEPFDSLLGCSEGISGYDGWDLGTGAPRGKRPGPCLQQGALVGLRALVAAPLLPAGRAVNPASGAGHGSGQREKGDPEEGGRGAAGSRGPSPDVSVLAGDGDVFLRDVDVHVVQGGFLGDVVRPDEAETLGALRGDGDGGGGALPPRPPAHSRSRWVLAAPAPRTAAEEGLEQGGCFGAGLEGEEGSPRGTPRPYLVSSAEINAFISPAADQLNLSAACTRRTQG